MEQKIKWNGVEIKNFNGKSREASNNKPAHEKSGGKAK